MERAFVDWISQIKISTELETSKGTDQSILYNTASESGETFRDDLKTSKRRKIILLEGYGI